VVTFITTSSSSEASSSSDLSSDSESGSLLKSKTLGAVEESESEALFEKISGRRELVSLSLSDRAGHGEGMAAERSVGLKRGQEQRRRVEARENGRE
jgi:hypothetical protein